MGRSGRADKGAADTFGTRRSGIDDLRTRVENGAARIAKLGNWPPYISPQSLTSRVPTPGHKATGFDAGIAASLDLIPADKQQLAATLHAAYTPQSVERVREEAAEMHPDSQTTWWLAACSVCKEQDIDEQAFLKQIQDFEKLASDPAARVAAAQNAYDEMVSSFSAQDGIAFGTEDGCMQGAYIAGHDVSAMYASGNDLYFIGTLRPSLGLEYFPWKQPANPDGDTIDEQMGRSGPVHGSKQFVKCADEQEYKAAVAASRAALGDNAF